MMLYIVLIIAVIFVFGIYGVYKTSYKPTPLNDSLDFDDLRETKGKPKISAEVNEKLYSEVQIYCRKNSITVSELIRKSVGSYIGNH